MPGIPQPPATAPYDTLESVLNVARTRLNDAIASLAGDLLKDTQPFTGTMTNSAWRQLQAFISNLGFSRYKRKFYGLGLPVTATTDASQPCFWNWYEFYDGVNYYPYPSVTVLPQDLICPLYLAERHSGSLGAYRRMEYRPDGLMSVQKQPFNRQWEWKFDNIYLPGSTSSVDIEVEYTAYDIDFPVDQNNVLVAPLTQRVPIMRSQSAFANYLCAEMAGAREDLDVETFIAKAEKDVKLMMNNDVRLKQRTPVQRQAYGRGRGVFH